MNNFREKLMNGIYYVVIFIVSLLVVVFVPMISTDTGLSLNLPTNEAEWLVFIFTRAFIAVLNMIIFASFINQAKLNVKDNEKFIEANKILGKVKIKEYIPESPKKYLRKTYLSKGASLFLSSLFALVAISQAVIKYDYNLLLSYAVTLIMGIVMGLMQMTKTEEYWISTYYDYAKMKEREFEATKEIAKQELLETEQPKEVVESEIKDDGNDN